MNATSIRLEPSTGVDTPTPEARNTLVRLGALGAAYFLAHRLSYFFPDTQGVLMAIWPAGGIALAGLLLTPKRLWPASLAVLFVAGNLANLIAGRSVVASLGFVAANLMETLGCAWLILRFGGGAAHFSTLRQVLLLLLAAAGVNAGTAVLGAGTARLVSKEGFWRFYETWFVADGLGILLVTPLLAGGMAAWRSRLRLPWTRWLEGSLMLGAGALLTWCAFGLNTHPMGIVFRPYYLLGAVAWAALRFGVAGVAASLSLVASVGLYLTVMNLSAFPLGGDGPEQRLLMVQIFLGVVGMIGMLLAASYGEQKSLARSLHESQERYAAIFRSNAMGVGTTTMEGRFLEVNDALCELLGYSESELIGRTTRELDLWVQMDQRTRLLEALRRGPTHRQAVQVRRKGGEVLEVMLGLQLIELQGTRCLLGSMVDLTERKRAEDKLREGEARFQAIFSQSLVGAAQVYAQTGRMVTVNQKLAQMLGYTESELLQRCYQDLIPVDDLARGLEPPGRFAPLKAEQASLDIRYVRKNGENLWCNLRVLPLGSETLGGEYQLALIEDVTERIRMERSLLESQQRFSTLFQRSPLPAAIQQLPEGRICDLNDAYITMFGYAREEVIGHSAAELNLWAGIEDRPGVLNTLNTSGAVEQLEVRFQRRSGQQGLALLTTHPIELNGQRCLFSTVLDITDRKQMEEQLRQSQKMEGIGHLAGGIAHEFNNILAGMMMNLSLAEGSPGYQTSGEMVRDLQESCRRAAVIVKQLLAFSRQSVIDPRPLDIGAMLSHQLEMLRRFLGERVELGLTVSPGARWARADRSLIEQVVLNLCLNAKEAMKAGGRLSLKLSEENVAADHVRACPEARIGRYLCLAVQDTGCGMDERTMGRLFEPFFTTKGVGGGTGLGLATVRGIVQQHQGWVEVESSVGRGSTFRVFLPTCAPSEITAASAHLGEQSVVGTGTILMVEDEPRLRKLTRRLFTERGYTVLEAGDGAEALAVWAAYQPEIRLLYTDMVLPGDLSGAQLAQRLMADQPGLKVIITSGYNSDLVDLDQTTSIAYLPKPCHPTKLMEVIAALLAGGLPVPPARRSDSPDTVTARVSAS